MRVETDVRPMRPGAALPGDLECAGVGVTYRGQSGPVESLREVSIHARQGEFVTIIGPSGCGKSTLLAVLAGLRRPDTGAVRLGGREITGQVGLVGLMPQRDLLLPWKRVLDNAALPLRLRGVPGRQARRTARDLFPRFGLSGFERAWPAALSGGMRQRVALLRTFLTGREVLLLDEPFGALDALTRAGMQEWLLDVWSTWGKTVVLVTHDVDEAIYLSDRIYIMSPRPGRIRHMVDVPLARTRRYDQVVTSASFTGLKRELLGELRGGERVP